MKRKAKSLKVAIVYDRVNKFGGAERVLLELHKVFPNAPLFTAVYDKKNAPWASIFPSVKTSFIQKIPFAKNNHYLFGWLTPIAFEQFNFSGYDLVISVTSEAAKGIITTPRTLHICYCLTPTRYIWSERDFYLNNPPKILRYFPLFKYLALPFLGFVKWWDEIAANRPDYMIAISNEVKERIKKYYNRDSIVVFPPIGLENKKTKKLKKEDYFLIVSRLEAYKRVDLAVKAFNKLGRELIIVGSGSEKEKLMKLSKKNIKFLGEVSDTELSVVYQKAKAFIMPQNEDFGITAIEAFSFETPVIAYKKGGSVDTVIDGKTGLFFEEQTPSDLIKAIRRFDRMKFDGQYLKNHSKNFSKENFRKIILDRIESYL